MQNLETANFFSMASRVFVHPFKTLLEFHEAAGQQSKGANFKLAFLSFITGNTAMIVAGMIMDRNGTWDSIGFILFSIFFQLTASLLANIVLVTVFYLFLVFLSKEGDQNPEIDRLFFMYFLPDMLFTGYLPLAFLLSALGPAADALFGLAGLAMVILSIVMKIRAISILASISKGKSVAVFFLPMLLILAVTVMGAIYTITFVSRMFM